MCVCVSGISINFQNSIVTPTTALTACFYTGAALLGPSISGTSVK